MYRLWNVITLFGLSAVVLLGSSVLRAQEPAPPKTMTLQDCIAIAQGYQIDLLNGKQSLLSAKAKMTQEKSAYFPQATASYTPVSVNGSSGDRGSGTTSETGGALVIKQNIYDGGLREVQVKSATLGLAQNEATLRRNQQTVTYNVTTAYYNALRAQHLAAVVNTRVKSLEAQLELVRARIEAGDAAKADELPVKAQLANARVDQLAAKNAIRTTLIQLQTAIGLPLQEAFPIEDVGVPAVEEVKAPELYVKEALLSRPDVSAKNTGVEIAKSSVKTAKINAQPRLVSDGQFSLNTSGGTATNWKVNVGIAYDLFDGKRNKAVLENARISQSMAEQQATQLAKDIVAQVQQAYLNLTNARERMAAAELSAQASQQNFDAQSARYKEGLATPLDLLSAQVDLATAQNNAVGACYDYYVAKAQLEYAIGKQGGSNAK